MHTSAQERIESFRAAAQQLAAAPAALHALRTGTRAAGHEGGAES
jgi:hypothetical protein